MIAHMMIKAPHAPIVVCSSILPIDHDFAACLQVNSPTSSGWDEVSELLDSNVFPSGVCGDVEDARWGAGNESCAQMQQRMTT